MIRRTFKTAKTTASFFAVVLTSFNPFMYRAITQKPLKSVLTYFLYFILLLSLASSAIRLPIFAQDFSGLNANLEVTTKAPIESSLPISGSARIFANTSVAAETAEKYGITVANKEIKAKPIICLAASELCRLLGIKAKTTSLSGLSLTEGPKSFLLLMLPGLFTISYLLNLIKYSALASIATILSYALIKIGRRDNSFVDAAKISLYAATVPAILDLILFLLSWQGAWLVPLGAYAAIVAVATLLNNGSQPNSIF